MDGRIGQRSAGSRAIGGGRAIRDRTHARPEQFWIEGATVAGDFSGQDKFKAIVRSMGQGKSKAPWAVKREAERARAERLAKERKAEEKRQKRERNRLMGSGEVGENRLWYPPYHALTDDGRPVTVAEGKPGREGHVMICDGHVNFDTFFNVAKDGLKGHDHFSPLSKPGDKGDRGRYTG